MVTATEFVNVPPFGLIVGVATVGGVVTPSVNPVVLVTPPPEAVTVIVELPTGVAAVVPTVRTVEQEGLQEGEEKDAVAPVGSPETENETD